MKTIEEGNMLIAEFLGCYKYPENSFDNVWSYEIYGHLDFVDDREYEKHYYLPSEMKFHDSWDWLMPVVEFIEDVRVQPDEEGSISYHRFAVGMPCGQCEIVDTESEKIVAFGDGPTKRASTYVAVVEFIEWYNKNKES